MKIYTKLVAATLPLVVCFLLAAVATTYYFSYQALNRMAERWLDTRLAEALRAAAEQEAILHLYGLENVSASVAKAQLDAAELMSRIEVGEAGRIFALDAHGIVVVHPNPAHIGRDVSGEPWFRQLQGARGRLSFTATEGRNLAMYGYFPPWQWYVLAADPEDDYYGAINRIRPYIVSFGVLGALMLALALMLLTRRLTRPLRALTAGVERIGRGELETPIAVASRDEFGRLADVFNRMGANLKKTLTALQDREEHYRAVIENASDIVTILDAAGAIHYHSPSAERVLGYRSVEIAGKHVLDFIHPEDAEAFRRRLAETLAQKSAAAFMEVRIRHADGSWRTLEAIGQNLVDHPAVGGIVVNARDITQRKQAEAALQAANQVLEQRVQERTRELHETNQRLREQIEERQLAVEALRESDQKMRAILKASPVGIGLVIDRQLDWANDALFRMVGYDRHEVIGRQVEFLYADREEYDRVGRVLYSSPSTTDIREVETQLVRGDGARIDCTIRAFPLNAAEPSQGQIIAVADISQAKHLEAALQRSRKMEALGTLAGGVAHDLNNILSGIVSYPELLLLDLPEDSPLKEPIRTIKASGQRAAAIVQDLLTMARRGVAVAEVVNLNAIVDEQLKSIEFSSLRARHPDVRVSVDRDANLLNIKGSATHLAKTVLNLVYNAAEAMPEGGTVRLATRSLYLDKPIRGYEQVAEGDYVCLAVADSGVGISETDRERIFEPFYTKKEMGRSGTGLGMAVVWGTVKDHGGYIDVQSVEGRGTTISLYFPVSHEERVAQATRCALDDFCGQGERILVVDDSEVQREIATRILEKIGYRVEAVASGEAAVAFLRENAVDLIVLDMIMAPGMDGLDTYRRINALRPGQRAVIASGYSETERVREAQRLGAGLYIKKPYTIEKIGLALKETLAR
jgi:PAS domain S-box-containing protein